MATNSLTADGLTIQTLPDILAEIIDGTTDFPGMKAIYGDDINIDPNTPDGQSIHINAQAKRDMLELIQQVYQSFDPDEAIGINLDRRCAINGIKRAGGTYTQQPIEVTVDRALTLTGKDDSTTPFTVQDLQGNKYLLVSTHAFVAAGTASLVFQAENMGAVTSALNAITVITTITLGVIGVNNSLAPSVVGIPQEPDGALRTRRARSVSIPSKGYLDGLIGSLLDLGGVQQAEVFENVTSATDLRGVPGHSIWVIVLGGTAEDIAQTIYKKRSLGCGMRGSTSVSITQADGIVLVVHFDRPIAQPLYIRFNVAAMTGLIDTDYLRAQILQRLSYKIDEMASSSEIVAIAQSIYPNASISEEGVSTDNINFYSLVSPITVQHQFSVAEIEINGTVS